MNEYAITKNKKTMKNELNSTIESDGIHIVA